MLMVMLVLMVMLMVMLMLLLMVMMMLMLLSGEASPQRWLHCAVGPFAAALRDHADGDALGNEFSSSGNHKTSQESSRAESKSYLNAKT